MPEELKSNTPYAQHTPADAAKGLLKGVLLAGVMGAVAWGAMQTVSEHRTYLKVVQPAISDACSPVGPYQGDYRLKGVDTTTASSLLIKHPEKTQAICAAINGSLTVASKENAIFADNTALWHVANSLGMDSKTAHEVIAMKEASDNANKQYPLLVEAAGNTKSQPTMVPATQIQAMPDLDSPSMSPNL